MNSRFFLLRIFLLLFLNSELTFPVFNFSSRDSRIRLTDASSKLIIETPITNFDGTLEVIDNAADRI